MIPNFKKCWKNFQAYADKFIDTVIEARTWENQRGGGGNICYQYNYKDCLSLYVHYFDKNTLEKIEVLPNSIFSFGVLDKYVILNCRGRQGSVGGIYCYDTDNKACVGLVSEEDAQYLFTSAGNSNNIYAVEPGEAGQIKVLNIEIPL